MPFAGRAQAHDKPNVTRFQSRLIGMPHHRRVKQRSRLNRILHGQTGPEQLPTVARKAGIVPAHHLNSTLIIPLERLVQVAVPPVETSPDGGQPVGYFRVGVGGYALADVAATVGVFKIQKAGNDPFRIGREA